jgi:hypothetical protein
MIELLQQYGWKFVAVYYSVYAVGLSTLAVVANQGLITADKVTYCNSMVGITADEEITDDNMYKVLAKSAGFGYLIDLDKTDISPVVGSLVVGFALNLLLEPLRLPLVLAITARIARRA